VARQLEGVHRFGRDVQRHLLAERHARTGGRSMEQGNAQEAMLSRSSPGEVDSLRAAETDVGPLDPLREVGGEGDRRRGALAASEGMDR